MQFLRTFTRNPEDGTVGTSGSLGSGELVYMEAIRSMCAHNEQSFEVFYSDLAMFDEFTSRITEFLTDHPDVVLPILNEVEFHFYFDDRVRSELCCLSSLLMKKCIAKLLYEFVISRFWNLSVIFAPLLWVNLCVPKEWSLEEPRFFRRCYIWHFAAVTAIM